MLNKPVGMRFIVADTTALLHMGRGILSYLCRLEGDSVRGDYVQGDFVRFPVTVNTACLMLLPRYSRWRSVTVRQNPLVCFQNTISDRTLSFNVYKSPSG